MGYQRMHFPWPRPTYGCTFYVKWAETHTTTHPTPHTTSLHTTLHTILHTTPYTTRVPVPSAALPAYPIPRVPSARPASANKQARLSVLKPTPWPTVPTLVQNKRCEGSGRGQEGVFKGRQRTEANPLADRAYSSTEQKMRGIRKWSKGEAVY